MLKKFGKRLLARAAQNRAYAFAIPCRAATERRAPTALFFSILLGRLVVEFCRFSFSRMGRGVPRFLADKEIDPLVNRKFPLLEARQALELLAAGSVEGKIVLSGG